MKWLLATLAAFVLLPARVSQLLAAGPDSEFTIAATDWPWWRGSQGNGIATAGDRQPPLEWSQDQNIRWRAAVPGRGHGSPMVFGDHVYLATADKDRQLQVVLCFDRHTGKQQWEAVVHEGGLNNKGKLNEKASLASATVATDTKRLFINFLNDSSAITTALDFDGEILWQQKITDYVMHQGYASSPAIYKKLVLVSADNKAGGAVAGLDRETGEFVWRHPRPQKPNYPSPVVLTAAGRDQLILSGCDLVTSLDPLTGELLWEIEGATTECVTTAVTDGTHVFTSGGYPDNHVAAVAADGSGNVTWRNNNRVYVPSMLQRDGYLFATLDAGVASCFRCSDGKQMWKARLGGTFSSSPVMVGDLIYATSEEGATHIFRADPNRFTKLGENQLGTSVFATPAICGDAIFTRVAIYEGQERQEYLYCIGD